jgi:transcriptional regulator GlxA family with amidase domain
MTRQRSVALLVFDGVEVLDFAGPFEVFSVTSEINETRPFNVQVVAEGLAPIRARNGLSVNPDAAIADVRTADILIVPGGQGTRREINNPAMVEWIASIATNAELVLSVCTGSFLLARAGLLAGLTATTHHHTFDLLRELAPDSTVVEDQRFVDNGKIVTSGGISAGIDMSLHIVARLLGEETAARTASYMEYEGKWR